jgi:hypothetical protein
VKLCIPLLLPFFALSGLAPECVAAAAGASATHQPASPTPTLRFRFDAGAPLLAPAGVGADGSICVGTEDGYIHLLGSDGAYRWSYSVHGAVTRRPLFAGELWYVATSAERIYALTRDGSLYWVFKPPSALASELATDSNGLLYFIAADHFLYGVTAHGGVSVRAQFGIPKAGPSPAADGSIWAENQAGGLLRARGQAVQRFQSQATPGFDFGSPQTLHDPEGRTWQVDESGKLIVAAVDSPARSLQLTNAPLLAPIWSPVARYVVVSARNGLVTAIDPPRSVPSR